MSDFVIEKEKNEIVLKKYNGNDEHVVVPDGVTGIGEEAFRGNERLKSVTIPEGVSRIKW